MLLKKYPISRTNPPVKVAAGGQHRDAAVIQPAAETLKLIATSSTAPGPWQMKRCRGLSHMAGDAGAHQDAHEALQPPCQLGTAQDKESPPLTAHSCGHHKADLVKLFL